jgi:polysaccharide export outer membrane protein
VINVENAMNVKRRVITGIVLSAFCCVPVFAQQPARTTSSGQKSAPVETQKTPTPAAPASTQKQATPADQKAAAPARPGTNAAPVVPAGVATAPDYVIGADDVLGIVFWREPDVSADVSVRPDGKISLPLLNDVQAAGLTPGQLRLALMQAADRFVEDPAVTVVVKAINSRKVFITGQVARPGVYPLSASTTVLQMIATAGGVAEYAKSDKIIIMRTENGKTVSHKFNYKNVSQGKNLPQNIELKPGDTIIVP